MDRRVDAHRTPRLFRRTTALTIVTAIALFGSACGSDDAAGEAGRDAASEEAEAGAAETVDIKVFQFSPKDLEISAGTTVTWTNSDEILHTVTDGSRDDAAGAIGDQFDGQLTAKGETFEHTFTEAGTFAYHCTRHPGMDATVTVS